MRIITRTKVLSINFAKIIKGATNLLSRYQLYISLETLREKRLVSKLTEAFYPDFVMF